MRKIFLRTAALAVLILGMWTMPTMAAEVVASGNCGAQGDNLTWTLDLDGVLTISGSGVMADYDGPNSVNPSPWNEYRGTMKKLVLNEGITVIGERAFEGCASLGGALTIPSSVQVIKWAAFAGCSGFTGTLKIPENVTYLGKSAFQYCKGFNGSLIILAPIKEIYGGTFENCGFTGKLTLPDSLIKIDGSAFKGCSKMTGSLELPSKLIYIGDSAFMYCRSFSGELKIPNSVKTVDRLAFAGCSGFTGTLKIPYSVTLIGTAAFSDCTGFTGSLRIPDTVETIRSYAFDGCTGFNGTLELPKSLKIIQDNTFYGCNFTGDLIIPASVERIRDRAFTGNFDRICFLGNAPTVHGTDEQFTSFNKDEVLYFIKGRAGWTTPTWKGYATAVWNTNAGIDVNAINVPKDEYWIIVQDSDGRVIQDATVTWESITSNATCKTDENGIAKISKYTVGEPKITVTAYGYKDYSNEGTNYSKSETGYEIIKLYQEHESELFLVSAFYSNDILGIKTDILTGTKRLSITEKDTVLDNGLFDIRCETKGAAVKYALVQEGRLVGISEDGLFKDLQINDFEADKKVVVRVYDANQNYVETALNLLFVEDKMDTICPLQISLGKVEYTVGNFVPFIGGKRVAFDIPEFKYTPEVYIRDDTVRLGVNIKPPDGDEEEYYDELEENFAKLNSLGADKNLWNNLKKISNEKPKGSILGTLKENADGDTDFYFVGYGEGKFNEKGIANVNLHFALVLEGEFETSYPIALIFSIAVEVNAKGELVAVADYNVETATLNGDVQFEVTPGLEAGLVAGADKVVSARVYGEAKVPIKVQLIGTTTKPGLLSVDLTGELGAKTYLLFKETEYVWAYNTWHLYTRTNARTLNLLNEESEGEVLDLYDVDEYLIADTSYLSNESSWLGGNGMMFLDLEQTNIQELQTSTYRNMQPQIASLGDNLVMVWTGADTSREAYNLTQLKYSVHNGIGWSEPQAVDSNETADYLHDVYSDGENLWVVYQESATSFGAEPSMEEAAADMQIVVAKFDTTTGGFTDHTVLSNEGGYESIPAITIVDGKPYAVWTSNSDTTDLFGQNDTNEIHYAEYDGEWSAAQVLASGLGPVVDLSAGDLEGKASVAYVSSADTSLGTDDDNLLYTADFAGTAKAVSEGIVSSLKFAELPGESKSSLVWYDNGSLKTLQNGVAEIVIENGTSYAAGFDVLSDRIIFNHATDGASDVFASIYEDGAYQEPVRMTYQDSYIQSYSFVEHNSKAFAALVQTDVTITENAVEDDCTLSFLTFEGVTDVSLESAAYDDADLVAGEDLPVEVILKNTGDTLIKKVQLTIMDENNEVCTSVTETVDLASHEEVTLTVDLPIGDTIHKQVYTVKATAENDANADNNSWQILVGDEMLSVSGEMIRSGSNVKAIVKVLNDGHETTGGTLTISSVSDGTVLIEKELTELAAGESHLLILDGEYLLNGKESDVLQLAVETTAGNNYSANRMQQMYISRAIVEEETVENTLNISEVDGNVIGVEISNTEDVDVAAAVYDAEGKMLAYEISTDIRSNIYNYEAFVMDLEDLTEGQTVKAFMLKTETREPLCEAAEYVVK